MSLFQLRPSNMHVANMNTVNIGSGNDVPPIGTKPLPNGVLSYHSTICVSLGYLKAINATNQW